MWESAYQFQLGVLWVVVLLDWVIAGPVVGDKEGPPPAVTPVLVAAVQDVGMEEEGVARFHLDIHQGKYLERGGVGSGVCDANTVEPPN